ncbi:MAG: hypothetical protein HN368_24020 [Spirochaetales bacterium]|nr:hypothetical protein [Spirochaetales bacterium]
MGRIIRETVSRIIIFIFVGAALVSLYSCEPLDIKNYITKMTNLVESSNVVYVSADGDDSAPGTIAEPKQTIQSGIDYLVADDIAGHVHVAAGTYEGSFVDGTQVTLSDGISLRGGWSADFSTNDPAEYETVIIDTSTTTIPEGGNCAVLSPDGVTLDTVVEGFTIIGGGGSYANGIKIVDSSPTIRNCVVRGGHADDGTTTLGTGIFCYNSSAHIDSCEVTGGSNPNAGWSNGIYLWNCPTEALIENCTIFAGAAAVAANGITCNENTSASIIGNSISGGTASSIVGITAFNLSAPEIRGNNIAAIGNGCVKAIGISLSQSTALVIENTISAGAASDSSRGITIQDNSAPRIKSNIIAAGGGIYSSGILNLANTATITIDSNIIFGGHGTEGTQGIIHENSKATIKNNIIHGGSSLCSQTSGILMVDALGDIRANSIYGGSGTNDSTALFFGGNRPENVSNNILFIASTAGNFIVSCAAATLDPEHLEANLFFDYAGTTNLYRRADGNARYYSVTEIEAGVSGATGNVFGDPMFMDIDGPDDDIDTWEDNNWHLSAASPVSVTEGGVTFIYDLIDMDGASRSIPWSIGPYEYD